MVQDLTLDEIVWKYEKLNDKIISQHLETSRGGLSESISLLPEDKNVKHIKSLICGSLVYLHKIGAITITLHKKKKIDGAYFTTTRFQCEKTSWSKEEDDDMYDNPSGKVIPVPILFEEKGNDQHTHISLIFNFPDTKIGTFCKRMIGYLRQGCKKDVNVINAVIFMHKYFTRQEYIHCMPNVLLYPFIYDYFNSLNQTPSEVEELMSMILEDEVNNLYDPFMRTGTNILFTMDKYHAQATDLYHFYATMLIAGVLEIDTKDIELANCITSWDPRDCDAIIASPEFNMQVTDKNGDSESITTWTLENVYKSMDKKGRRGLLLLPASVLTSLGKAEQLRHDISEANLLDTIVLLPADLFPKTSISTTLILLKSNREENQSITFADFSSLSFDIEEVKPLLDIEFIKKAIEDNNSNYIRTISIDEIRKYGYEWYVPKYIRKQEDVPVGFGKFTFNNILHEYEECDEDTYITSCYLYKTKMVSNPFDNFQKLKAINNLRTEKKNGYLYLSHNEGQNYFVINCGDNLKTFFFEFDKCSSQEFLLPTFAFPEDCFCYSVDIDTINIDYLRLLLHETYVEILKNNPSTNIAELIKSLMNTEVIIPLAIEEQANLYEQAKLNYTLEKARKEGLDEAINSMKQEYMMEVRMRKHDMKPYLSQLDSQAKLISFHMDKIVGNEPIVAAIKQKLLGISNAVSELRLHLNRLTEEDIYGDPELVNPVEILKDFCGTFKNYTVDIEVDTIALGEAGILTPKIFINRVDFSVLSTTIIENAVTHAFINENKEYKVLISLTYDKEKSIYIIDFKNNGELMPLGMDKFRYGLIGEKSAKSKGTGLGGYRVKSITHHFGGDYDVFCNRTSNLTTIRVYFPKYSVYE